MSRTHRAIKQEVRLIRSHRFSAMIGGVRAIWDLELTLSGVPDRESGMIVNLRDIDQWLAEATERLSGSSRVAESTDRALDYFSMTVREGLNQRAPHRARLIQVALESGTIRYVQRL